MAIVRPVALHLRSGCESVIRTRSVISWNFRPPVGAVLARHQRAFELEHAIDGISFADLLDCSRRPLQNDAAWSCSPLHRRSGLPT